MPNGQAARLKIARAKAVEPGGASAQLEEPGKRVNVRGLVNTEKLSSPVKPLLSLASVVAVAGALVGTIFLTHFNAEWVTFLGGVLVAALLAEATRVTRAEWALLRRTAQLSFARDKLEREARARRMAEQALAASKPRLHVLDDLLQTMVVMVDADARCRYHNRAFRDWLQVRPQQVEGMHLNEVLGPRVFQEIAAYVRQALDGQTARYERTQKMADGSVSRLAVTHIPQYAEGAKVTGFYMLIDLLRAPAQAAPAAAQRAAVAGAHAGTAALHLAGEDGAAAEIVRAIEKNEFRLFCQEMAPLAANPGGAEFQEILVRLMEEEEGLIPPGAFFPLAEKYGMMPHLDRWVVRHVAEWIAMQFQQNIWPEGSVYFINLSDDSIRDPGFADFLEVTLEEYGIPAAALCFEVPNEDLVAQSAAVGEFARRVQKSGARIALSGFGSNGAGFDKIRGYTPDFLKIDGGTLLSMPNDAAALARVKTIAETARKVGSRTIAEMVESEEVIARLKELGVDLAQGFGIARPRPLARRTGEQAAGEQAPGQRS